MRTERFLSATTESLFCRGRLLLILANCQQAKPRLRPPERLRTVRHLIKTHRIVRHVNSLVPVVIAFGGRCPIFVSFSPGSAGIDAVRPPHRQAFRRRGCLSAAGGCACGSGRCRIRCVHFKVKRWSRGLHMVGPTVVGLASARQHNHAKCIFWCSQTLTIKREPRAAYSRTYRRETFTIESVLLVPLLQVVVSVVGWLGSWVGSLVRVLFCVQYLVDAPSVWTNEPMVTVPACFLFFFWCITNTLFLLHPDTKHSVPAIGREEPVLAPPSASCGALGECLSSPRRVLLERE